MRLFLALLRHIPSSVVGVEKVMRRVRKRLFKEVFVKSLNLRVFVREAKRVFSVKLIEKFSP